MYIPRLDRIVIIVTTLFFTKQIMQFHTDPEYLEHLSFSQNDLCY